MRRPNAPREEPPGIAERFFDERSVSVETATAAAFLSAVAALFEPAPKLHEPGLNEAATQESWPPVAFFFRGQRDARHGLNSSLFRAIQPQIKRGVTPAYVEKVMRETESRVIDHARLVQGIGRHLTDLELLTVLQHHLAPTRLIDVSASWAVGLYFACETDDSIDGRLFAFALNPHSWRRFRRSEGGKLNWPGPPDTPWQETVWPVLLPFTDPRMVAQQGYFLAGGLATNTGRHQQYWREYGDTPEDAQKALHQNELRAVSTLMIKFPVLFEDPIAKLKASLSQGWSATGCTLRVPHKFKREIRELLRSRFGLHTDSVYPPIDESVRALKYVTQESN